MRWKAGRIFLRKSDVQTYIDHYMLLQAGIAVLLFILFILYFPDKPPLPPTVTSAINRTEFWAGTKQIFKNKSALLLCFSYSMGVDYHFQSWSETVEILML